MAKTLKLEDNTARRLYKTASQEFKELLEENFGKDFFKESIIARLNSIDDVYKELGRTKPTLEDYKHLPAKKRERALYSQYIDDTTELVNEGWEPDFDNQSQYKHYPWFEKKRSGWVLYFVCYYNYGSSLGAGFYYKDEKTVRELCAKPFVIEMYSKIFKY